MSDATPIAKWWPPEDATPDPRFAWPIARAYTSVPPIELRLARALLRGELTRLLEQLDATTDDLPARHAWRRQLSVRAAAFHAHAACDAFEAIERALELDVQHDASSAMR